MPQLIKGDLRGLSREALAERHRAHLQLEFEAQERMRLDLNSKLAEMVRNAKPGTSVDEVWNEFKKKYNPPLWYPSHK